MVSHIGSYMGSLSSPKLPVIDFSKENLESGTKYWLSTIKEVLHALEEYGCFVVIYDKIPLQLHDAVFDVIQELFDLPLETKRKNVSDLPYYGYVGHQPFIPDIYEGLGINGATTLEGTQDFTDTLWPTGNDNFCKTVLSYSKLVAELEEIVLRMVFEGYGVDHGQTQKESFTYLFRMMRYRPPNKDEADVGCDIHTDKGFLTILDQNQVNGLEVQTKDGQWIGFESSPSSFVVMAGDALLGWSNDRIHAPLHRVVMNGSELTRYSVALFSYGNGTIEVPKELIDEKNPLRFKPFDNFGLLRYFFTPEGRAQTFTIKAYAGI